MVKIVTKAEVVAPGIAFKESTGVIDKFAGRVWQEDFQDRHLALV